MTIDQLRRRIFKRWWVILLSTLLFTLLLFPWAKTNSYQASLTFGLNLNDQSYLVINQNSNDKSLAYLTANKDFSSYLESRFKNIDIQDTVAKNAGLKIANYSEKTPFYVIGAGAAGFVNLTYQAQSNEDANKFLNGAKSAYLKLVDEWNDSRQIGFRVTPMKNFTEAVVNVERPLQFQALPILGGWLFGILLAIIIPENLKKE